MLSGPNRTIRRARSLRREMSLPEVLLWRELRKRPAGLKFRRQQAAGPYVADFFCHEAALVLEIDGDSHNRGNQPDRDAERDAYLSRNGFKVLRIPAVDVLSDLDAVLGHIVASAGGDSPLHQPAAGPPPLKGRI
jgi:very-short-patch-repair endonuclease